MEQFFHKYSVYFASLVFVASLFIFASHVFAFGKPDFAGSKKSSDHFVNPHSNKDRTNSASGSAFGSDKRPFNKFNASASGFFKFGDKHLESGKLRACQSIEKNLTNRSNHLVELVTHMETTFTRIANGVEQYYLTKVVPAGNTLSNYDALVADITTKQNALTPLIEAAQADVINFSCTSDNPGASMTQYRTDMQAILHGLKDYRTSIKNLIVAVHTLKAISVSTTPTVTGTVSTTPTDTPTITEAPTATETATISPTP